MVMPEGRNTQSMVEPLGGVVSGEKIMVKDVVQSQII
jgi:hypothetical protein